MGRGFRTDESWIAHGKPFMLRDAQRDPGFAGKVSLVRLRLDSGGYDAGGAYWGHGAPPWSAMSSCGKVDMTMRAASRDAAKAKVREAHPLVRFYR
jgi:hypothetical protein